MQKCSILSKFQNCTNWSLPGHFSKVVKFVQFDAAISGGFSAYWPSRTINCCSGLLNTTHSHSPDITWQETTRIILSRKGLGCCRCRGLLASSHACHAFGSRRPLGIVGTGKFWKARFSWSHGGCRVLRNHKSKMDPNMDSHQPKMDPWKGKQVIQHGTSNLRLSFHFFSRPKWHDIWSRKIGF